MPLAYSLLVFDAPIDGSRTYYSDPQLNAALAQADQMRVFVKTEPAGGTSPTLTIKLQESMDNETWQDKTTLVNGTSVSTTAVGSFWGSETGSTPGTAFYRISVSMAGTSPRTTARVYVAGRTN